jgi:hypothetical protein
MATLSHQTRAVRLRDLRSKAAGQAFVEFALVVPIMMVLLLTVLDFGRLFYSQIAISNAAREGAFQASTTPLSFDANHPWDAAGDPCDVVNDAVTCRTLLEFDSTQGGWYVYPTASDVTMACSPSCAKAMGNLATVTVTGRFSLWSPWMGLFLGGTQDVILAASATSQIEKFPPAGAAPPAPLPTPTPTPGPTPTPTPIVCSVPSAAFDATVESGTSPLTVTFTDASVASALCPITGWSWNFDDGPPTNDSSAQPPLSHIFLSQNANKAGVYEVTMTVTNSAGSATSAARTITANP